MAVSTCGPECDEDAPPQAERARVHMATSESKAGIAMRLLADRAGKNEVEPMRSLLTMEWWIKTDDPDASRPPQLV
jgi:hypothetical protein